MLFVLVAGSSSGNSELDYHLAVLKTVHGVSGVHSFGKEGSGKQYGVFLFVRTHPEADRVPIRVACSSVVGTTKLDAALVAKQRVAAALGSAALEAAEERVRMEHATAAAAAAAGPPPPPSAFERMAAAQHVAPAEEAAAGAERLAAEARAELAALEQQLEAAAKKVEEAEARAQQLEEAADDAREARCAVWRAWDATCARSFRRSCRLSLRPPAAAAHARRVCVRCRVGDPGNSSCARMLTICGESVASEMWVVDM